MSAQLVLTDGEMEALQKCVFQARRVEDCVATLLFTEAEYDAAARAVAKFQRHLDRKSRRRPRR